MPGDDQENPQAGQTVGDITNSTGVAIGNGAKVEIHQHLAAPETAIALHQLPPLPRDFSERNEELKEFLGAIDTECFGIFGLGGIGKTTLAIKLAESVISRYPDAQIFLDLHGTSSNPLRPLDIMTHVIRAFYPEVKLPENEAALTSYYRSILKDKKAILVLDNARDAVQIEAVLPPVGCCLIITSRQFFALPGMIAKSLEGLHSDEARSLLLRISARIGLYADEIARLCGYLPLALRLTAGAIAIRKDLSIDDFVKRLTDAQKRLEITGVDATLTLSYDLLTIGQQLLWRALAVFPSEFDRLGAAAVWNLDIIQAQDALSDLVSRSLVGWNELTHRYRLHDLARDFANVRLSLAERNTAQIRHAAHYVDVLRSIDALFLEGGEKVKDALNRFEVEYRNINIGQIWAEEHAEANLEAAQIVNNYPEACVHLIYLCLPPRQQVRWLEAALRISRQLNQREKEALNLSALGSAYAVLGELNKALECHLQVLKISREIGDQHREETAFVDLGNVYSNLGEGQRALENHTQALRLAQSRQNPRDESRSLNNLGVVYTSLGQYAQAITYHNQALQLCREIKDRRREGIALGSLGEAYLALNEPLQALSFYLASLEIVQEIGDRRGENIVLMGLGQVSLALGKLDEAFAYQNQAFHIAREIGDRRGESKALNYLGNLQFASDHFAEAIGLHQQALIIIREIGDRSNEAIISWDLGRVYEKMGDLNQAIAAMKIRVEHEREIGHAEGEMHASYVEKLQSNLNFHQML
jgi:tetratricopeptide (TPR) repeat protein